MSKEIIIKKGWTKCSACGWVALSFWNINEERFPLKCNMCGLKKAQQMEWNELSEKDQDVLIHAIG